MTSTLKGDLHGATANGKVFLFVIHCN